MAMNDDNTAPAPFPLWTTITIFVSVLVIGIFLNFVADLNLWASEFDQRVLEFYKALGTVLVAIIAAGIAGVIQWRQHKTAEKQWKTAQQKLNYELFDRRFLVYSAIYDLQENLLNVGDVNKARQIYFDAIRPAEWLFNKKVFRYLIDDYLEKAMKYTENMYLYKHDPQFSNPAMYDIKMKELNKWLQQESILINSMFEPYLKLEAS